jgi:hypothetical protein
MHAVRRVYNLPGYGISSIPIQYGFPRQDAKIAQVETRYAPPLFCGRQKAKVGGVDFNKARMRRAAEAVLALSWRPDGFTSSELADQVTRSGPAASGGYSSRQAAYDLKKLRGKQMVERVGKTRAYRATQAGLRSIAAWVVLREKAIRPLLAAAQGIRPLRGSQNPTALDRHYETVRAGMAGVLQELGVAA